MKCHHPHLLFEDGDNVIKCVDCSWVAESNQVGTPHPMLMMDKSRHSKWELPRDKPLVKPEDKKKPKDKK